MDGILLVNKPIGITSRDVVNIVSKKLKTKKIGHTGTLDPMAEGVLVLCIGKATKIVELLELPKSTIDSKIGDFYTSMTTDKRFVLLDGLWDLRCRHTSDKVLVKLDEEEEEIDEENLEDDEMDDEIEEDSYDSGDNDDDSFGDSDDLSDLVVIDEEDLDLENN